jgi:glycosyltransferase involved in cell wall biosynthesis
MRVTVLLRCLAMMHGGGETHHLAWIRELQRIGDEVTVITGRPLLAAPRFELDRSITVLRSPYFRDVVYRMQGRRGFGRLGSQLLHADEEWFCHAAWRAIAAAPHPPDVVHVNAVSQAARLRRGSVPVSVCLFGLPHARYFADLRLADAVVADGWSARHLPAALGRDVDNVPKGVDSDRFRPDGLNLRAERGLRGKRVALVASRLVPIKNVGLAIDAMTIAAASRPDLVLLIAGEGPLGPELKRRAGAAGISDRVLFLGHVPPEDMPGWYRSADFYVLSSDFDNSPNVLLEAMASGLPIVSTDVGGVREYLKDQVNGLVVPARDAPALARAMTTYADDPDLTSRVGRLNRDEAVSTYSWARSTALLRRVFQRIIARRRDRSVA